MRAGAPGPSTLLRALGGDHPFDRAVVKGTRFARGEDKTPAGDYSGSPTRCRSTRVLLVPNMCVRLLTVLFVIVAFAGTTRAQNFPPGSYQRNCKQVHWAGRTLVAECQRVDGHYGGTGLADAAHCHGDIANIDGQLRCVAEGPPAQGYAPPPNYQPGYPPPSYQPGYPPPSYQPGYPGYGLPPAKPGEHRARCEELWHHEHEIRERLEATPLGDPDHERLEYRLHEVHEDRERSGCER